MKQFFTDTNFLQNFIEVGLKDKLVSTATSLGFEITITQTCIQELPVVLAGDIQKDIDTGSIKIVEGNSKFTGSNRGEESIIEWIQKKTISNASVGTADKGATKTFNDQSISVFDHIEFLWIMVRMGIVSFTEASWTYTKWKPLPARYEENFLSFYVNHEKQILKKLGIFALLDYKIHE